MTDRTWKVHRLDLIRRELAPLYKRQQELADIIASRLPTEAEDDEHAQLEDWIAKLESEADQLRDELHSPTRFTGGMP